MPQLPPERSYDSWRAKSFGRLTSAGRLHFDLQLLEVGPVADSVEVGLPQLCGLHPPGLDRLGQGRRRTVSEPLRLVRRYAGVRVVNESGQQGEDTGLLKKILGVGICGLRPEFERLPWLTRLAQQHTDVFVALGQCELELCLGRVSVGQLLVDFQSPLFRRQRLQWLAPLFQPMMIN